MPISKEMEEVMKVAEDKCLKMIAFVDEAQVPLHLAMGTSDVVFGCENPQNAL